jgi:hypothetical protein
VPRRSNAPMQFLRRTCLPQTLCLLRSRGDGAYSGPASGCGAAGKARQKEGAMFARYMVDQGGPTMEAMQVFLIAAFIAGFVRGLLDRMKGR